MAGESSVKVLGASASSFANRVQIALNLKSVEYELLQETFFPKSDLLLKSNPVHKKVPVFFNDDKTLCESLVIVQYIDEYWSSGPTILPVDPYDRAIARFWSAYVDDKWATSFREYRTAATEEERSGVVEKMKGGLALLEEAFVKISKGNGFFGGESIGYLDISLGCFLGWLKATEKMAGVKILDESATPNLVVWARSFLSHEAVKGVIPDPEVLIDLINKIAAFTKSSTAN